MRGYRNRGFVNEPLSERIARKRARCQNGSVCSAQAGIERVGNAHHAILDIRVFLHHGSDIGRELITIDRERTARIDATSTSRRNKLRTECRKLRLQHAGSAFGLGALQRVRAHELSAIAAAMHIGFGFGAHLEQTHVHAALGELKRGPRCLRDPRRLCSQIYPCSEDNTPAWQFIKARKLSNSAEPAIGKTSERARPFEQRHMRHNARRRGHGIVAISE